MVAAIQNGTFIDHIHSNELFQVVRLLHLEDQNIQSQVMIGYNLPSNKMGNKSIIKIADKFFTDAELNILSVVAPNVTLCIIRDYEVVEKRRVTLPMEIVGIVKCANPKCITNNEPMPTHFHVVNPENGVILCKYCEKEQKLDSIKLI